MKTAKFNFKGSELELGIGTSIQSSELYGSAKRIVVKDGQELVKGMLTADGRLFPKSEITRVQQDSRGSFTNKPLVLTEDNQEATLHASTFKVARDLEPLDSTIGVFPNFATESVYPILAPESLGLGAYKTKFAYKDTYDISDAILTIRKGKDGTREAFLLVGEYKDAPEIGPIVNYNFFEAEDTNPNEETSEELAFGF